MPYIGRAPSSGIRSRFIYTATASQTTFTGADGNGKTLGYTDGEYVDVYLNGVLLDPADYTATSKTSVVLDSGATVSDIVEIVVYDTFSVFNGTFTGDLTVDGDTLFVDASADAVGIGTTSPVRQFHVNAASGNNAYVHLTNATTGATTTDGFSVLVTNSNGEAILNQREAQPLSFRTQNTERMRILSGGGLTFNGDTADANALDDYEEGSWTPGIDGMTFTATDGVYTKIGKRVQCSGIISECTSGTASAVGARITGLPYTVADSLSGTSLEDGGVMHYWINLGVTVSLISIAPSGGTTECFMYRVAGSGGTDVTSVLRTDLDASDFACRIFFSYVST